MIHLIKILNKTIIRKHTTNEADRNSISNRAIDYTKRTSINLLVLQRSQNKKQHL
jgi:hypothetical protein